MRKRMKYDIECLLNDYGDYIFGIIFVPDLKKFKISAVFPSTWIIQPNDSVQMVNNGSIGIGLDNIEIYPNDDSKMFDAKIVDFMISVIDVNKKLEKKELEFKNMINKLQEDFNKEKNTLITTTLTTSKKTKKDNGKEINTQEENTTTKEKPINEINQEDQGDI